jgi:hypothetical protein
VSTFAEFVAESYHSEASLIWRTEGVNHAVAVFTVKSLRVEVAFEQREPNGPWHVSFDVIRGDAPERTTEAFRVFNGVFQAVREFVETREPELMVFISKSESLAEIYSTYLRRERPTLQALGYHLEGPFAVEPYTQFTLRRIPKSGWK